LVAPAKRKVNLGKCILVFADDHGR